MRSETNQIILIASGLLVTALFGVFLYREIFPEYRIYQNDYIALEEFRSTYTHQPPPPFQQGVKQVVLEREDKGPAVIDRCTSCHVALQIPYFSPTKIAYDLNGNIVRNEKGHPLLIANDEYIWQKLDEKIAELRDEKVLEQLKSQHESSIIQQRLDQAANYEKLKTAHVGEQVYDVTKVLRMHPLMGNEIYPFQYHPVEEYGCTSCHNGNGRGLVTDKAHGPVFDGQYEAEDMGHTPKFIENDPKNDPKFARIFNGKPGMELIFQTEPIFVGSLIQAKCVQCHQTADVKVADAEGSVSDLALRREKRLKILNEAYLNEKKTAIDLLRLHAMVEKLSYAKALEQLQIQENDYSLPAQELEHLASQIRYLKQAANGVLDEGHGTQARVLAKLNQDLVNLLGSDALVKGLEHVYQVNGEIGIDSFLKEKQQDPQAKGILFAKAEALDLNQDLMRHAEEAKDSFSKAVNDKKLMSALISDVDELTLDYQRGKELYISQACYACHRITGFTRGGVGPDLTRAGDNYPWYLKRKLIWPQGDLATSTMPNMHFDTEELEDIMTFLLAQKGSNRAVSKTDYHSAVQAWEAGKKMDWEKPISPAQTYDLRYSMTVFATQGCAACHRLQGFESNVGFAIETASPSFDQLYAQQQWFKKLFPEVVHFSSYDEELPGSDIVKTIDQHAKDIDERIVDNVRQNALLEEIDQNHPEVLESLYSTFRYAARAKNDHYQTLIDKEEDSNKIAELKQEWKDWKTRVHRVLMMYIQTYGLGRLVGPHLNWSGIYRSDEWLMEHFHNPASHVPRSIMPVFPFDDTKFFALTHMLDVLAVRNRNAIRQIWEQKGFNPEEAYNMLCAQCHGIGLVGNGVISEWIYPIPKNLRNQDFLRNLTKDQAFESIQKGVKGTPMPGWGEVATDKSDSIRKSLHGIPVMKENEIRYLVDWIFKSLPGGEVIRQSSDVPKWQYGPQDVLKELKKEGGYLEGLPAEKANNPRMKEPRQVDLELPEENGLPVTEDKSLSQLLKPKEIYFASLQPMIVPNPDSGNDQKESEVEELFDVVSNPNEINGKSYYIKKEFYTPYNIQKGQDFFLLNCAVCHGNEADGSGARSQAMQEAKPRMLTNLDWLNSHDDLRLLRSIKFGVPGTSMTPWGDLTNSLQRLQLVIFIRSLTKEQEERSQLYQALYQTFEAAEMIVEDARIEGIKQIERLKDEQQQLHVKQQELKRNVVSGKEKIEEVIPVYQKNLELEKHIESLKQQDKKFIEIKAKLKSERDLYFNNGISLMSKELPESVLQIYFNLIQMNANRYSLDNHQLLFHQDAKKNEEIRRDLQLIVKELDFKITELELQRKIIEGKIISAKQREDLSANQAEIEAYKKMKAKLINDIEEALRLVNQQSKIMSL